MTVDEPQTGVVDDEFLTIANEIHRSETEALTEVMSLIDKTLSDIGRTNICSSGEIADALLDIRNIVSPIVESRT